MVTALSQARTPGQIIVARYITAVVMVTVEVGRSRGEFSIGGLMTHQMMVMVVGCVVMMMMSVVIPVIVRNGTWGGRYRMISYGWSVQGRVL